MINIRPMFSSSVKQNKAQGDCNSIRNPVRQTVLAQRVSSQQLPADIGRASIQQLQRSVGNRAVAQMFRAGKIGRTSLVSPSQASHSDGGQGDFVHAATSVVQRPNHTGLPDELKQGAEFLSGHSLDDVNVHYNSSKPIGLQSLAYTSGAEIHVAPGAEQHLPHEIWHVVQQKEGRVKATHTQNGTAINDDPSLEQEAERKGRQALETGLQLDSALEPASQPQSGERMVKTIHPGVPIVQRYLIVNNVDYTRRLKDGGEPMPTLVGEIVPLMLAALDDSTDPVLEQNVRDAIQNNPDKALIEGQIKKWITDAVGVPGVKSHPEFGRKNQARAYANYKDLALALYGWVKAKPARHDEKVMANQIYDNPVIEFHLNNVFAKIKKWIDGRANKKDIKEELKAPNKKAGTNWDDYRSWFNRVRIADGRQIPERYYPVLKHPENFSFRDKTACLHDLMRYFMAGTNTKGDNLLQIMPAFEATRETGRQNYKRPESSVVPRDAFTGTLVPPDQLPNGTNPQVRVSKEELDPTFLYARKHGIPMWARHSFTAARMMNLTQQVLGNPDEISAVAWSIMAFWRKGYDHRSIPYHTLHEIMDLAPAFGVPYDPTNRGADLQRHDLTTFFFQAQPAVLNPFLQQAQPAVLNQLFLQAKTAVLNQIAITANLPNWSDKAKLSNEKPEGVGLVTTELATPHTLDEKLEAIRAIAAARSGWHLMRAGTTRRYYQILARIPNNLAAYSLPTTTTATRSAIIQDLRGVRQDLLAFHL